MSGKYCSSTRKRKLKAWLFGGHSSRPCCFCRRPLTMASATLDHVTPRSEGGGFSKRNLRLSCKNCNQERGAEDFAAFRAKRKAQLAAR